MHSGASSIHEDDLPTYVHGFDISKYRDGRYRFVPASDTDSIAYSGRVLHHGTRTSRKSKVNTVQFDWSAVSMEINVTRASTVGIRLKGDGTYVMHTNGLRESERADRVCRRQLFQRVCEQPVLLYPTRLAQRHVLRQ